MGGQIQTRNTTLPSYLADLNTLAQKVADQVNTTLGAGIDSSGAAPVSNLFTYDPVAGAAYTLAINPLTPDQIAAAVPGAPGGNGNALNLAALANAQTIGGYTFTQFYGNLAGRYGSDLAHATSNQATGQQLVTQSQSLRSQASGISLDREAARMVQFQKAFNATSKMITVLDQLTNTMINLIK